MTTEPNKSPPAHTPLPWKMQPLKASSFHANGYVGEEKLIGFKIDNGEIEDIVTVDCRGKRNKAVAAANAAFIVHACNSHYDLLNTLNFVRGWFVDNNFDDDNFAIFEEICACIAKARGQQ
jgi:hypothetical protein